MLQALDGGGKEGLIRRLSAGLNPQGCRVTSFKVPSGTELSHDFLWRVHQVIPARGEIGIFNRSHYEDVLIVRVHQFVPKAVWSKRYDQINDFERMLGQNDVTILKFFLHISKDEQKRRIEQRLRDPAKQWKLAPADFQERKRWKDYIDAYESVLSRCSADESPWFIIPSRRATPRDLASSAISASFAAPSWGAARTRAFSTARPSLSVSTPSIESRPPFGVSRTLRVTPSRSRCSFMQFHASQLFHTLADTRAEAVLIGGN